MVFDKDSEVKKPEMQDPMAEKAGRKGEVRKEAARGEEPPTTSSTKALIFFVLLLIIIIAITLALILAVDNDDEEEGEAEVPFEIDFTSGVSLVTYYGINATISQRLARTVLTIKVANALDCVSIHGVTLQLPLAARVASLRSMTEQCSTYGKVQTLEEARDTFAENAQQGLPGAYVEARDSVTYSLQVSMEPYGETTVELVLEELLRQRVGEVEFQIPLVPSEKVDQVSLRVTVLDIGEALEPDAAAVIDQEEPSNVSGPTIKTTTGASFRLDVGPNIIYTNETLSSPFFLDIPDAREHNLPQILRGFYHPKKLAPSGALHTDGRCFEMFFLPTDLQSKPRNIIFLLDGFDPYERPDFNEMKGAVKTLIDSLTEEDRLTIQVFGDKGTEYLWGTAPANAEEKTQAKQFLDGLAGSYYYGASNLHEAFLEGLLRAKRDVDDEGGAVTLLVLLSANRATAGQTNRTKIASDVWNLNSEGQVKIFSFGFEGSDIELLRAIAIMNGGVATSVLPGTDDFQSQLDNFFDSEFGNVLLSDVQVELSSGSDTLVYGETRQFFPVLSQGSEIVVRGLLDSDSSPGILKAVTTAMTSDGEATWTATAEPEPFTPTADLPKSLCFQSYAHSRITQLMHFRDAAELLGDGVLRPVVKLTKPCNETTALVDCIKQEALSLALEANVVTRGLTGLVTIDEDDCMSFEGETEVCLDGTSEDGYWQNTAAPGSPPRPQSTAAYTDEDSDGGYGYEASGAFPLFLSKAMFLGILLLVVCLM